MGDATVQDGISFLQEHSVPTFRYPEDAVRSIGKLSLYAKNRLLVDNPLPEISIQPLPENISRKIDSREPFSLTDAQDLVHSYGFTTPKSCVLPAQPTADDIQKCQSIGNSLAVKIVSKDISHKTDVGGVQLSVAPADLSQSIQTMTSTVLLHKPDALIEGFLISEMIDTFKSIELLVGFRREEGLGTVIVCGSGGIFVELYADVAMRFDPASQTQWEQALSKLKIWKIIEGYRGKDGYPKDSIFAAIARITEISRRHPFISELDINPLLLYPNNMKKDPIALDARISFNTP